MYGMASGKSFMLDREVSTKNYTWRLDEEIRSVGPGTLPFEVRTDAVWMLQTASVTNIDSRDTTFSKISFLQSDKNKYLN